MSQQPNFFNFKLLLKGGICVIGSLGVLSTTIGWTEVQAKTASFVDSKNTLKSSRSEIISLTPPTLSVDYKSSAETSSGENLPKIGKDSYLDTNSYKNKIPKSTSQPSSVVIKERSGKCLTIVKNGQLNQGTCPNNQVQPSYLKTKLPLSTNQQRLQYNLAPRSIAKLGNGKNLLFPLSIPGIISSGFGWRINPFTGFSQLHEGTDLVAPIGTPVLAAYSGRVEVARPVDGYGLAVFLRHEKETQESRYAHMSAIFVQEGEWVEQGTVIGLLGNTGLSTGPHLHFEWRQLTKSGWVALDSQSLLQQARQNLISSTGNNQINSPSILALSPPKYHRAPRALKKSDNNNNTLLLMPISLAETITSIFGRRLPLLKNPAEIAYMNDLEKTLEKSHLPYSADLKTENRLALSIRQTKALLQSSFGKNNSTTK